MPETKLYVIDKLMEPEEIGEGYASSLIQLSGEEENLTPGLPVNLKLREMTEEQAAMVEARPHVRKVSLDTVDGLPPEPQVSADSSRVSAEDARRFHNVHRAHEAGFRGKGARVAVLDTGIDAGHAERLGSRLVAKESMVPGEDWRDTDSGHGTWCAGCIAEIAPEAEIIVIKVLSTKSGSGSGSGIIRGISRAVELGATHVSMSLGGEGNPDDAMCRAVDSADGRGVLVPCAAGNDQDERPGRYNADDHHPGCSRRGICVPAVDAASLLARFSNWGVSNDVAGIGVLVEGWGLNGSFGRAMSGTSMACPHVAGIAALGTSTGKGADEVKQTLYSTARDTSLEPFKEGNGIADAGALVAALAGSGPSPQPEPAPAPELPKLPSARMLELHNKARQARGVPPLKANEDLAEAALAHSKEMIEKDYFSHDSHNGEPFTERLKRAGYAYVRAGENIAWSTRPSVEALFRSWMNSPGHRRNILNPAYKEVGFGLEKGDFKGRTVRMWTANFGTRNEGANRMSEDQNIGTAEECCPDCGDRVAKKPENPGGGRGGKGRLMQAHVFHGTVISHDLDSVVLKVDKYNRGKKNPLPPEVDVFVSSTTNIVVGDQKGTIDSLAPGLSVVAVCRAQADGSFVARNVVDDAPEEG